MIQPGEFPEGKKKKPYSGLREIHTGTLVLEARRNAGLTRETRGKHSQLWIDTHIQADTLTTVGAPSRWSERATPSMPLGSP